jgi:hypothetical protein
VWILLLYILIDFTWRTNLRISFNINKFQADTDGIYVNISISCHLLWLSDVLPKYSGTFPQNYMIMTLGFLSFPLWASIISTNLWNIKNWMYDLTTQHLFCIQIKSIFGEQASWNSREHDMSSHMTLGNILFICSSDMPLGGLSSRQILPNTSLVLHIETYLTNLQLYYHRY